MVTLLHELIHKKRILYFSKKKYFLKTPEKLLEKVLDGEMGYFLEKELFGKEIFMDEICFDSAKELLNGNNYDSD